MIYIDYERAQQAFDGADQHARLIIGRTNSFMISDTMRHSDLRPRSPFDMRYFYHSLVSAVGQFLGRPLRSGLEGHFQIIATHYPDLTAVNWKQYDFVTCGLADTFLTEIRKTSGDSGSAFDVEFACAVACNAIDNQLLVALRTMNESSEVGDDFDNWLAGFNK
jgi:hypothetical protein